MIEKKSKVKRVRIIGKEETKLSIFLDKIIVYINIRFNLQSNYRINI